MCIRDRENYDARIAEIRTETDLVKREALMHEAEDELMNTWAIIPLYYYNDVYMQKTDVENIYSNLFGFKYFGFAKTPDNTLSLQIASEPNKLDPALNSTVDGACLAILAFSGLYSYNADGEPVSYTHLDVYKRQEGYGQKYSGRESCLYFRQTFL